MPSMSLALFVIGSAAPALLLAAGVFAFRGLTTAARLAFQLALLVASAPAGVWIIDRAFPLPAGAHHHSDHPGQGVIYVYLLPVWLLCFAWWSVRLAVAAGKAGGQRPSPRS